MQELVTHILVEIRSAWRFRWVGAAVAWIVCLAGWAWVAWQPNVYEANAVVYVDASSALQPYLSGRIVRTDVGTQLSYVREALLGREHLERVVRDNNLDAAVTSSEDFDKLLDRVRQTIRINSVQAAADNRIYNISYRHTDRRTAVGVVRTLLNSMIENTLGGNRENTDAAQRFLDERIREYELRLQQAEQNLAEFRRRYVGRLPGTIGSYFEQLQEELDALAAVERQLVLAEARRDHLRQQLRGDEPVLPLTYRPGGADTVDTPETRFDSRIAELQAELDRLLLRYRDKHPDVIALQATIERLEAQRAEELERLASVSGPRSSSLEESPVYQSLQIRLNEAELEIAGLRTDIETRRQRIAELRARVDEVPEVEAEFARLNRDYDVIYDQYQALVRSRETQALSSKASDADQVDFHVINPPLAGIEPVAPRRLVLLAAVFVFGLGAGGGVCYLLSQIRPVFGEMRVLREVTGLPVLGVVSEVVADPARLRQKRLAFVSFVVIMLALTVFFAGTVAVELVGPGIHSIAQVV